MKLKKFLIENQVGATSKYSKDERESFLEACRSYGGYRDHFAKANDIQKIIEQIGWIVETAEQVTLQETENWFDDVTVNRHMKQLKESYKILEKTGMELRQSQQRFEAAYDDIGTVLGKYYEI